MFIVGPQFAAARGMKLALVPSSFALLLAAACGGAIASPPDSNTQSSADAGSGTGSGSGSSSGSSSGGAGASSGASTGSSSDPVCRPGAACTGETTCAELCGPGVPTELTCECDAGQWACHARACVHPTPAPPCPLTAAPKSGMSCNTPGTSCDYGECQPQCECNAAGTWSCSQDDCVPAVPPCPTQAVATGDSCDSILQRCEYAVGGDKTACTCSIHQRWSCVVVN